MPDNGVHLMCLKWTAGMEYSFVLLRNLIGCSGYLSFINLGLYSHKLILQFY